MATIPVKLSYEDFEPFCKWQRQEGHDTLEVHLHGFKKEQVRIQLTNLGILVITGERPSDGGKICRFCKEIRVSKACKTNEIHAKFSNGILRVVMPKRTPLISPPPSQDQPPTLPLQDQQNEIAKPRINGIDSIANNNTSKLRSDGASEGTIATKKATLRRSKGSILIALMLALLIAIGAFVMWKYYQSSSHIWI